MLLQKPTWDISKFPKESNLSVQSQGKEPLNSQNLWTSYIWAISRIFSLFFGGQWNLIQWMFCVVLVSAPWRNEIMSWLVNFLLKHQLKSHCCIIFLLIVSLTNLASGTEEKKNN